MPRPEDINPTQGKCLLYCHQIDTRINAQATGLLHTIDLCQPSIHNECSPQPLALVGLLSMEDSQQKQPSTEAAPALSAPTESSNSYAAVIENRAKEVGVAVLHLDSLKIHISQFIEAGRCGR